MKKILTLFLLGFLVFQVSATPKLELKKDVLKTELVKTFDVSNDAVEVAKLLVSEVVKDGTTQQRAIIRCIKKTPSKFGLGWSGYHVTACVEVDGDMVWITGHWHSNGQEYISHGEIVKDCKC